MPHLVTTGNLGRDAEFKTTQNGKEFCSFSVADSVGYGDNKQTLWIDVTRWGAGAEGLARILRKGSNVTCIGEMSTREHNGKTYIQCRADNVSVNSAPKGDRVPDGSRGAPVNQPPVDDLDDDIPYIRSDSLY